MQPIIVITIYRRYHELQKNIDIILERCKELDKKPYIFVVWVNPEVGRIWFFQELVKSGKVSHVISRLTENKGSISYEESRNIQKALDFINSNYKDYYVIVQTADITVQPGAYGFIQQEIKNGAKAVLFHMENSVIHHDIWHTNFFAVTSDVSLWPPLGSNGDADILERKWGKVLRDQNRSGFAVGHNYNNRRFIHNHESERLPSFPIAPQNKSYSVNIYVRGRYTLRQKLRRVFSWPKLLWNWILKTVRLR